MGLDGLSVLKGISLQTYTEIYYRRMSWDHFLTLGLTKMTFTFYRTMIQSTPLELQRPGLRKTRLMCLIGQPTALT